MNREWCVCVCVCVCIKWHFPSQLFVLLTLLWWELLAFTKHTPDCGGWGGEVGKATLKRIQTEIMGEETMSNQKKLTRDVRLTGVNSRALEGGARHPSSQGPESSWTHCTGPVSKKEIQPCFTAPSWNYTKLWVSVLPTLIEHSEILFYCIYMPFSQEEETTMLKFWVQVSWDRDGGKERGVWCISISRGGGQWVGPYPFPQYVLH